ncbi:monovalent cation/H(+) antiporter subunit G [Naumannella huperziae]
MNAVLDIAGALLLLAGSFLCLTAAIGLVRLPDVLTRMHAATKPQTLGLLCVLAGLGLTLREPRVIGVMVLAMLLQLATAPVAAHMVGRTAYRTHQFRDDLLDVDDLAEDLSRAGFELVETPVDEPAGDGETAPTHDPERHRTSWRPAGRDGADDPAG